MTALLLASALLPLALAPLAGVRWPLRPLVLRLAPWTGLPALGVALGAPAVEAELPWLLLGARLGLDGVGRVFLLFTALLWTMAGVYARAYLEERRAPFFAFYLLSMSGSLGLAVAQDVATFYAFFALMTFSAYGLIVHEGGREALRAGRVYVVLAVAGEAVLLAGALLAASSAASLGVRDIAAAVAASPWRDLAMALLLAGFGIKAGALPLHVWLPLAHPVAPTPASAVLSGSMIKAGLLGWLRFLPLGEAVLPGWGTAVIVVGLVGAFFGVVAGVAQEDPKTTLAYSSISQMGIMSLPVGLVLMAPEAAPAAVGAVAAYAVHHGLVKGALFLGVGVAAARAPTRAQRSLVVAGLVLAALAMAGAPLTSGSVAKHYVKDAAHLAPEAWTPWLDLLLPLTAVGTTLLMARFLVQVLALPSRGAHSRLRPGLWAPWLVLLLASGGVLWLLPRRYPLGGEAPLLPAPVTIWISMWPVVVGGVLAWSAVLLGRRGRMPLGGFRIAAGDLLVLVERGARPVGTWVGRWRPRPPPDPVGWIASNWYRVYAESEGWSALLRMEVRLTRWSTAGALLLLFVLVTVGLLTAG